MYDDTVIPVEALKTKLIMIHEKHFTNAEQMCSVLGKDKRKAVSLQKIKTGDARFVQKMLLFVNGALSHTWGIDIMKTDPKAKTDITYRMRNASVETGVFNNPWKTHTLMFGDSTPILGKVERDEKPELHVSSDDMLKQLTEMKN
jgi:hypothetical protein